MYYNGTGAPPSDEQFVATNLPRLIEIKGTADAQATGISLIGIGLRDTSYTYMDPWGVPSGGDWALHRGGAVFAERTQGLTVAACKFSRVDGNALMFSGRNRDGIVDRNEFVWVGDTAMAAWGYTDEWDGTAGEQPRDITVSRNFCHELGVYQLQSSCWFQAKSARITLAHNIFFNGPRSGINFNDGFGGGNLVERNAMWNQCRQSGDHGPINSWDRQLYLTDVRYGTDKPSFNAAPTVIRHNVIYANYGGSQGVDNDDGSSWYDIYENFIYGEGLKMDCARCPDFAETSGHTPS